MKHEIDLMKWNRKEHYEFFTQFEEPFFGITVTVDCTLAYRNAKEREASFFLFYLYRALKAANSIEPFRYRIIDKKVYVFDQVHASPTIDRPDGTFGFAYLDYHEEEPLFYQIARKVIAEVRQSKGLHPAVSGENVIHFSAMPRLDFTSLSHARSYSSLIAARKYLLEG
jgi:chloramphenicol O-acetyltransferase type A